MATQAPDAKARAGRAVGVATPPAPSQLATPTDLDPDQVAAITEVVNGLIADAFALYVKTKNYHWHLAGPHFRDYHLMFDEQADMLLESLDVLAERVRRIGGTTIRSVGHVSRLQSIADDNDEFVPAAEMLDRLLADNRHIAHKQREGIEICERNRDTPTSNILQDLLDKTEKRIWFLFEAARRGRDVG
jgi:starvation-inducible DNA-binding protein